MRQVAGGMLGVVLGSIAIASSGCLTKNEFAPPPPPQVTVAKPEVRTVTVYLEENGQTEAVERAEVTSRVEGIVQSIAFTPGTRVQKGQVLYKIEPDQYQAIRNAARASLQSARAAVQSAEAEKAVATAAVSDATVTVERAQLEFERQDNLLQREATPQSTWDSAKTALDQAKARLQAADASVLAATAAVEMAKAQVEQATSDLESAQLNLDYTTVTAPIDGAVTRTDVKQGNLVKNGTRLTTVVNNDSIFATFFLSERQLLQLMRKKATQGQTRPELSQFRTFLQRSGDEGFPFEGVLEYLAPEIDQETGTLLVRAQFPNPDAQILPGFFVRVRVERPEKMTDALLVPQQAVSRDNQGSYVLTVVQRDGKSIVQRKDVQAEQKVDSLIVISSGLTADDQVIVRGLQRARHDAEVTAQFAETATAQDSGA